MSILVESRPDDLPTTAKAFDTTFNGGANDGFIAKFGSTFNDTIGVFSPSQNLFLLRNSNSAGQPDLQITFGQSGDQPLAGDWNGDGIDEPGVFRPSTGQFLLLINSTVVAVNFGQATILPWLVIGMAMESIRQAYLIPIPTINGD